MELCLDQFSVTAGCSSLRGRVITSIADVPNIFLKFEGREVSFVVSVDGDDEIEELQETHIMFCMEAPLVEQASALASTDAHQNTTTYPFEIAIPSHLPGSMMFQGREGDKCSLEYSIQARHRTRTTISVAHKIHLNPAPTNSPHMELVLKLGARVPMTKSYFCGLWEQPIDTYILVPSLKSLVLQPNQSFRLKLLTTKENTHENRFCLCYPIEVKLTQQISWSAQSGTTDVASTVRTWTITGTNEDTTLQIPNFPSTYRGRLLRVHHEMIVYTMDDEKHVVSSTPVVPVQVVEKTRNRDSITYTDHAFSPPMSARELAMSARELDMAEWMDMLC